MADWPPPSYKSEVIVVSWVRNIKNTSSILLQGEPIVPSSSLWYLGIRLDCGLTFQIHIEEIAQKAAIVGAEVGRLMPNIGGQRGARRGSTGGIASGLGQSPLHHQQRLWSTFWNIALQISDALPALEIFLFSTFFCIFSPSFSKEKLDWDFPLSALTGETLLSLFLVFLLEDTGSKWYR